MVATDGGFASGHPGRGINCAATEKTKETKQLTRIIIALLTFITLAADDLGGLVATARAAEPPSTPILRIETGMHSAIVGRIATDSNGRWLVTAPDDKSLRVRV